MKQEVYTKGGLNGAALKWIAIITMTIDHFASGFILDYHYLSPYNLLDLYDTMRLIGRVTFPIFAFLIVQGYQHTSNVQKYVRNMFLFAFLSEIPFDLAFYDQPVYWDHQNIFFTLATGVLALACFEKWHKKHLGIVGVLLFLMFAFLADTFGFDYGFYGVAFIFGLGVLRDQKKVQTVFGVLMGLMQRTASFAFIFIWFYNGKRGKQNKWFFYTFYPAHILVIYWLRLLLL